MLFRPFLFAVAMFCFSTIFQADPTFAQTKKDSCIAGSCKEGTGTLKFTNGNLYTGAFKDGLPHGQGDMQYAAGTRYTGTFEKGLKHGQGTFIYKSGNRYEGQYIQNRIEGKGVFYFANGDKYEGAFVNGDFEGPGTFRYASGNVYTGDWVKNKKNGKGSLSFPNGSRYEGDFRDDKLHGKGTYRFRDGSVYTGDFQSGDKHGHGTYVFRDSSRYDGQFQNDAMQGNGVIKFANGERYDGLFVNGMSEGKGTYYYKGGDKFEGTFVQNLMDGAGTYTAVDGSTNAVTYKRGVVVKEAVNIGTPQTVEDTLQIEPTPPSVSPDSMHSRKSVESTEAQLNKPDTTHQAVLETNTTSVPPVIPADSTSQKPTPSHTNELQANASEAKQDVPEPKPAAGTIKPVAMKCGVCNGAGKKYQAEITRKRVVTKDISNGVGPKNYVTYTVDDVVRPAGHAACAACNGSGRKL